MKSKLKKSLSLLLALVMAMSCMSMSAFATDDAWDGSVASAFDGGTGTSTDPYQIATGAQLAYLRQQVNDGVAGFATAYYTLTADIDLGNQEWTPIGNTDSTPFSGVFDGNGKTISGLTINSANNYVALFGYIKGNKSSTLYYNDKNDNTALSSFYNSNTYAVTLPSEDIFDCRVMNLTVSGADVTGSKYAAAVVANCANATVKNVHVTNSSSINAKRSGGVVADVPDNAAAFIDSCTTENGVTVTATDYHAAGILARVAGTTSRVIISNCTNNATVNSTGTTDTNVATSGINAGGITGQAKNTLIYNCTNNGNVTGKARSAGIATDTSNSVIIECVNNGNITSSTPGSGASYSTAGIDAYSENTFDVIVNCTNTGSVTANCTNGAIVSGVVGGGANTSSITINNCVNTGVLTNNDTDGLVYDVSNLSSVEASFSATTLTGINEELVKDNKNVRFTSVPTLTEDACTITPTAQEIITFDSSPTYLTLNLSGVTTNNLRVNVSNATINVTGNADKNNLVLNIVGSGNNITYAKGNNLSLKQLGVYETGSTTSNVTVSATLGRLSLNSASGTVNATVSEGVTVDRVGFATAGGTYTLNNYGTISHTQSDSNQFRNEHTVCTEANCTVTVNNYGTIEAKPNSSDVYSYAVLLYCTKATVNEHPGSTIIAEADFYKIIYGEGTDGTTNDYRETEVFGTITDMTLVVGSDNKLVYTFALNDAGKALSNPQVKLKIEGKDDYLEAKSEAEFNASDKTVYTVSENSGVYTLKVKIFAKYMNAKVSVELWDGDSQKAIESYSRSQYTVEGYDSYKTAQTGLTFGYSLVEYLGYYAGVTKDSKYSALYTAMVPYAQAAAAWR